MQNYKDTLSPAFVLLNQICGLFLSNTHQCSHIKNRNAWPSFLSSSVGRGNGLFSNLIIYVAWRSRATKKQQSTGSVCMINKSAEWIDC